MVKETAEQKLLKMMQKTGSAPVSVAVKSTPNAKFSFSFSMKLLNRLLIVGIVICGLGLAYEMRKGMELLNQEIDLSDDSKPSNKIADIALPVSKDIKYYLNKPNSRNIFRPYDALAGKTPGAVTLSKRLSKYKLVGVAWLDLPETASVMIEDTAAKTTYFLKQGEKLENVTVKTIYTDRAVFSSENEETIIKL